MSFQHNSPVSRAGEFFQKWSVQAYQSDEIQLHQAGNSDVQTQLAPFRVAAPH